MVGVGHFTVVIGGCMKHLTVFVVIILLMLGGDVLSTWADMDVRTLKKGVVKVTTELAHGKKIGTGFIIGQSKKHIFIVTASHVVEGESEAPKSIQVTFFTHQEESMAAKIVKKEGDDPRGLALLKVGGDLPEDIQILSWDVVTQVKGGEEIHLIGFPRVGGNAWAVTKGTLSGFDGPVLKFSGAVAEGNSGGPVLHHGQVIGVVMEVTGQFGNAKPAQIAKFTVENWPGYPRHSVTGDSFPRFEPNSPNIGPLGNLSQAGGASLRIESTPENAAVFVDDEFYGNTGPGPVVVPDLEPDEYDVLVKKNGFRSWFQTIALRAGEQRTLKATLQEGQALRVTGIWKNPQEPTISYVLTQEGNHVTMTEVTTNLLGTVVTAQGEGQLQGNQLEIIYRTAVGTMGQSTATLSEDGQQLVGAFQDFSTMVPLAISLMRTGDLPENFSPAGSSGINAFQHFGQ